jgi:hypothetical protein
MFPRRRIRVVLAGWSPARHQGLQRRADLALARVHAGSRIRSHAWRRRPSFIWLQIAAAQSLLASHYQVRLIP